MRLSFTFRWFTHSEINSTKTYYYSTHSLLHHKVQTSDTAFANQIHIHESWASLVAQLVKNPSAMQETWVQSLGWEDPLEKGKPTQTYYSGIENSMDYIVHGVAKGQTRLNDFHFHFLS